jgi:amino acid transporter
LWIPPEQEFHFMGTVLTVALAFVYSAGNLGVFMLYTRERKHEFNLLLHAVFPLVSSIVVLYVAYMSMLPAEGQKPPIWLWTVPWVVGIWLGLGIAMLVAMKALGREQWLLSAGAAAQDAGSENAPATH